VAVPLIAGQLGAGREEDADRTASALLTWAVLVLLPLSVLLAVLAHPLSRLLLGGAALPAGSVELGARMLVVFAPQVVLYGIGIVLTGVLQAHRRFLAAALAPLLSSLVVIAAYALYAVLAGSRNGTRDVPPSAVAVLAGGTTLGVVVLSLPLLVPALRAGVRLRPALRFPPGAARRAGALAGAGVVALVAQQAAVFATLWLTNHRGGTGTVTVYGYVQAVYLLPYAVLAVPIATSAFPSLAHAEGGDGADRSLLARAVQGILVLTGGSVAVLMAVSGPVGRFFAALDRGTSAASRAALQALPEALSAYAPGLVGFGLTALLTRALYVRGRPALAAGAVAAGWLVAAVLPLLAVPPGAGPAHTLRTLGLASAAGMTLSAALLAVLVQRAWGADAFRGAGRTLGAVLVSAALAAGAGDLLAHVWQGSGVATAVAEGVVVAGAAVVVYLLVMLAADPGSTRAAVERGRRRPGRAS
jgi:putative peptidoglycan lipid II flippase